MINVYVFSLDYNKPNMFVEVVADNYVDAKNKAEEMANRPIYELLRIELRYEEAEGLQVLKRMLENA